MNKIKKIFLTLVICLGAAQVVQANIFTDAWRWVQNKISLLRGYTPKRKVYDNLPIKKVTPTPTKTPPPTPKQTPTKPEGAPTFGKIEYYPLETEYKAPEDVGPLLLDEIKEPTPEKIVPQPREPEGAFENHIKKVIESEAFAIKINQIIDHHVTKLKQIYFAKVAAPEDLSAVANNLTLSIKGYIDLLTEKISNPYKNTTAENKQFVRERVKISFAAGLKRAEGVIIEEKEAIEEGVDPSPSRKDMVDRLKIMAQVLSDAHDYLLTPQK